MKYSLAFITLVMSSLLIGSVGDVFEVEKKAVLVDVSISDMLFSLGEPKPAHYIDSVSLEMIQRGNELIHFGRTIDPNGKNTKHISKFYKCISCHNTVKEDPNLAEVNPERRLDYAREMDIPFLQGSTFYGIVNRETWYNDDYVVKYGGLVEKAKNSLEESIQLCAEVCSQGRTLKQWEIESILAYFWTLDLKKSDLNWTAEDEKKMTNTSDDERLLHIKKKFLAKSPATFGELPESKSEGYKGLEGNPVNGKIIYELGCQHCHREKGESDVVLDDSKATLNWLKRNITANGDLSIYEIIRKGTYAAEGHKEYMPHYTLEKMSDQQIEDLRSYIESAI